MTDNPGPRRWVLRWVLLCLLPLLLLAIWVGCSDDEPAGDSKGTRADGPFRVTLELVAENNRGAGLMEQYKYKEAMEVFQALVDAHPDWLDAKVNLGIAVLNHTQKGAAAVLILEQVVAVDPDHAAATYCLGVSLFHAARIDEARVQFDRAVKQDPLDAHSAYFLARCLEESEPKAAIALHLKALELEPYFQSAHYRCFDMLRQTDDGFDKAMRHMDEFQLLNEHPLSVSFAYKYTLMGSKALAIRVGLADGESVAKGRPDGPLFDPPTSISAASGVRVPAGASLTTCDIDADGQQDLFVVTGSGNLVLLGANSGTGATGGSGEGVGGFVLASEHPLSRVSDVTAPLWGDFDNDGLLDVYLCRRGPNQLWRQAEAGRWEEITLKSKATGGDGHTTGGVCLDLDHDADLDLLLWYQDQPARLLNNNRDGTFEDISARVGVDRSGAITSSAVVADFDGDRDLDILLLGTLEGPVDQRPGNVLLWNDRAWRYHSATSAKSLGELAGASVAAAVAGDSTADGQVELYTVVSAEVFRWTRRPDGVWDRVGLDFGDVEGVIGEGAVRIALADVSGDGRPELLVGTTGWSAWKLPFGETSSELIELADSGEHDALGAWTAVVLDDVHGPSIVGTVADGSVLAWASGSGRHRFVTLALSGRKAGRNRERSNASGLGSIVLARVAGRTLRADVLPADSGPGQSLQPVALGLGGVDRADFLKVVWSEGVTQGVLDVAVGTRHTIEEVDLMPTSCPVLFAWDGERYRFVSDLLGVGGLGYLVEPGTYAPADPTENFLFPPDVIRAHEGRFRLKLTEPMPELTYLDRIGLVAWDLPPGWKMVLDERLATSLPEATGEPITYRHEQVPSRVTNERGEDVTDRVRLVDGRAADVGRLDERFLGRLAGEHVLVLEFDEPLDSGPAPGSRPVLLADGWVEFPYSQTAFSAWQAGAAMESPTLEALDGDGNWVEVAASFGYPGGMPRQMALPLEIEKLPKGTRSLRLRTNLEVYWDRLTVIWGEECEGCVRRELTLVQAELRESGFMVRQLKDQFRPHFEYTTRAGCPEISDPIGFYTRFGNVSELVGVADDAVAIFGPGEEIHLEFEESGVVLPEGFSRRLVLETVGWCKDMDLYTGRGSTVEPLPTTGRPVEARERLHRKYNTRYQRGW